MKADGKGTDYYDVRYRHDPSRGAVWREIIRNLSAHIPPESTVLEAGPGYCDFINQVEAREKIAIDLNPNAGRHAASDVRFIQGDCCDLPQIDKNSLDVVFASNVVEHLDRRQASRLLRSAHVALRKGGKLILLQPNFRYSYTSYYDDYTHLTPYTDKGLCGLLESQGFRIVERVARYLPLSMETAGWIPRWGWLVRLYLNLPYRPFAKQMLVVAEKP